MAVPPRSANPLPLDRGEDWALLRAAEAGPFRCTIKHYESTFRQGEHAHDRGTIDFTLCGGGYGTCGGIEVISLPGRVEFFAPGREHSFTCGPRGIRTMHLAFPACALAPAHRRQPAREDLCGIDPAAATGLAARLALELSDPDASSAAAREALSFELLAACVRWAEAPEPRARWIAEVRDDLHAGGDASLERLAAAAGVHRGHLARSFAGRYGVSIGEYHRRLRLAGVAARLAAAPAPLSRLAVEAGFSDQAHLTRWFRRTLGITPAAYARAVRAASR